MGNWSHLTRQQVEVLLDSTRALYNAAAESTITLTREREEAIARAERAERNLDVIAAEHDCKQHHYDAKITRLLNWACPDCFDEAQKRADRAEGQLAEARREVELLRAMLRSLQWSITRQEGNTYWAHCPRCLKRMDHGHADDCPLAAALNPAAAEPSKSALIQSAIAEDHDVLDALAPVDGPKEHPNA